MYFDYNGKTWADTSPGDWTIEVRNAGTNKWTVAHELGHASGIGHQKIDYENDTLVDLEENSLMQLGGSSGDQIMLNDYNFMMTKQAEIMQSHFGEKGDLELEHCRNQ